METVSDTSTASTNLDVELEKMINFKKAKVHPKLVDVCSLRFRWEIRYIKVIHLVNSILTKNYIFRLSGKNYIKCRTILAKKFKLRHAYYSRFWCLSVKLHEDILFWNICIYHHSSKTILIYDHEIQKWFQSRKLFLSWFCSEISTIYSNSSCLLWEHAILHISQNSRLFIHQVHNIIWSILVDWLKISHSYLFVASFPKFRLGTYFGAITSF